ncbi:MAG: UDP-3-O-(3-hydroxymyristoyl)glucosamine N-acyltransferase, partial [Bacteroidales bacterium]
AFAKLLETYNQIKNNRKGISPLAFIGKNVELGEDVYVGEFAVIEDGVKLGKGVKIYPQSFIGEHTLIKEGTTIYAGVKIYADNEIGRNCIIHAGVVIGADGFGFAPNTDTYEKVAQIGNVVLEDHVEIGANTCIDRATLGSTRIEKGVKLDNLIQIAHNVVVGKNTVMAAQVGIAGSSKVGAHCMFGGQVGIAGHAHIADGVMLAAQTGIASSITQENAVLMGSPSMDAKTYKRVYVHFRNLEKLVRRIDELEKKLNERN